MRRLIALALLSAAACRESTTPSLAVSLSIADGAEETTSRVVTLAIVAPGATSMRIAEGDLDTASVRPVSGSTTWTLSAGDGPRELRIEVRSEAGQSAEARDTIILSEQVYVSPSGDDSQAGTWRRPKRSIASALAAAAANQRARVRLFPGRYAASLTGETFPIELRDGIALESVFSDTAAVLDAENSAGVLRASNRSAVTVRDLRLVNGNATAGGGIFAAGTNILIESVVVMSSRATHGSGIYSENSAMTLRGSVVASNTSREGADAHGVHVENGSAIIHNNSIALHDSNGILITGTAAGDIRNNIFYANGRTTPTVRGRGICEVTSPHRTILRYNLFFANALSAVLFGGSGDLNAQSANALSASDAIEGNLDADPLFVNPAAGDFGLAVGSPARNAGDPNPAFNNRDGSRNDIGHRGGPRS